MPKKTLKKFAVNFHLDTDMLSVWGSDREAVLDCFSDASLEDLIDWEVLDDFYVDVCESSNSDLSIDSGVITESGDFVSLYDYVDKDGDLITPTSEKGFDGTQATQAELEAAGQIRLAGF
jgi:hypothetical protein